MDLLFTEPKVSFEFNHQLNHAFGINIDAIISKIPGALPLISKELQLSILKYQLPITLFPQTLQANNQADTIALLSCTSNRDLLTGTQLDQPVQNPLPVKEDLVLGNTNNINISDKNYPVNSEETSLKAIAPLAAATPNNAMLLGIYYGNQGWNMQQVEALESWQGKKNAVINLFTDWTNNNQTISNLFNQQLGNIWNNKNVPLVTWEPFTGTATPLDIEVRIANGEYDAYINTWADNMKTFLSGADAVYGTTDDRRAYLRFAHEMNGNWYPWSAAVGNNSPTDYINMWQHVKTIFDRKGMDATRLQWVWSANNTDVGGFRAEEFYPGDAYVDWIAVDGYNWGTSNNRSSWNTPQQVYGEMIDRLRMLTDKPLAITEFASTTAGGGVTGKSRWIADAFNYFATKKVKMAVSFNEDKETDWGMFGDMSGEGTYDYNPTTYKTYKSYQNAIASGNIIPSTPTNPRLLTDAQFAGLI
jgi:mannan endo-1,4-beta-mannosidase